MSAVPSMSGSSERPWVGWSTEAPNRAVMVAWRSTEVVSASTSRGGCAGPADQQRDAPHLGVDGRVRLAEEVVLAQVVAVVGADDHAGGAGQPGVVEGREQLAEPAVDHGQLGSVVAADVPGGALVEPAAGHRVDQVRRPDVQGTVPVGVVHAGVGLGGVEGLVGIELVDHQEEAVVGAGLLADPAGRLRHGPGPGEVVLGPEPGPRGVVGPAEAGALGGQGRRTHPGGVVDGAPRVALVAALVGPGAEVRVVVLAARLEQVGVVGDQHGGHALLAQGPGDGVLPDLDRAPGPPGEVERPHQDVVASGHARQRTDVVVGEAQRLAGEGGELRRGELVAAVGLEQVPVEAVEQHHHQVVGTGAARLGVGGGHGGVSVHQVSMWGRVVAAAGVAPAGPAGAVSRVVIQRRESAGSITSSISNSVAVFRALPCS